jgi:N-terminal domain of reverse transcriptase
MDRSNPSGVDRQWITIDGQRNANVLWNSINWDKIKQNVNQMQARIVKAVKAGNKIAGQICCWAL